MGIKDIKVGVNITQCKECSKWNVAMRLVEIFSVHPFSLLSMIRYDETTHELIVFEDDIMKAIQLVTPQQQSLPIRLEKGRALDWKR